MNSSGNGEGAPAAKKARIQNFFGDKERSDAVLQVKNEDLHIHKMVLAAKSPYFKELFFSEGSKSKKVFVIDEHRVCFKFIVNAAYNNFGGTLYAQCRGSPLSELGAPESKEYQDDCNVVDEWWSFYQTIMITGEKYGMAADIAASFEILFRAMNCRYTDCLMCTMRSLFALHYNFPESGEKIKLAPKCTSVYLKRLSQFVDVFNISPPALVDSFGNFAVERETKDPDGSNDPSDSISGSSDGPIVLEYGDSSLSDVTLVMGNYEFRVHKMYLANHSAYFRAMFFSGFSEKEADRVPIEADGDVFKLVMELVYSNGTDMRDSSFLECRPGKSLQSAWSRVKKFWKTMPEIMMTMEFFTFPPQMVETSLLLHYCRKETCVECANKRIFAVIYKLANLKEKVASTPITIVRFLKNFPECLPERLGFAPNDLAELIEAVDKKKPPTHRTH